MLKILLSLLLFLNLSYISAASIDDIDFITEIYPPYNFIEKGEKKGIAIDLLLETLKELNSKKTLNDIHIFPWVRGYTLVQSETEQNVLFSTTRTPGREKLFKWAGPIKEVKISLMALKSSKLKIEKDNHMQDYSYATVKDDVGELLLEAKGITSEKITSFFKYSSALKMLFHKRVDMIAYPEDVSFWLSRSYGYNSSDIKVVYELEKHELYYAFNLSVPDEVVAQFQAALDKVKANKEKMREINMKYLR